MLQESKEFVSYEEVTIKGANVEQATIFKYLGILVDDNFTFQGNEERKTTCRSTLEIKEF